MLKENLQEEIKSSKAEMLKLASSLIRAKSENPPGDTKDVVIVAKDFLESIGLSSRCIEPSKGHVSLIAEMGKGEHGLILCGHIDTVPFGEKEKWSFDPFSGESKDGRILGRGSADMKGGISSILIAVKVLRKLERDFEKKLTIAFFCDEETGGEYGSKWAVENGIIKGEAMIIGEGSNYHRLGHTVVAGEKGVLWSKIRFNGVSYHGSMPMLGENAITKATSALSRLRKPILSKVRAPHDARNLIKWGKRTLIKEYSDKRLSKPHYAIDHYTLNIGTIKGGTKTNIVADSCEVELDLRIPIGGSKDESMKIIESVANDGEVQYINYAEPSYTRPSNELVKLLREASKEIFNEYTPVICIPATTDAHYLRSILKIPVVSYGPGYQEIIHTYDEWVDVNDVLGCAEVYALAAVKFLFS